MPYQSDFLQRHELHSRLHEVYRDILQLEGIYERTRDEGAFEMLAGKRAIWNRIHALEKRASKADWNELLRHPDRYPYANVIAAYMERDQKIL